MPQRFEFYAPLKPFIVHQHFAENDACVRDFGGPNQRVVSKVNGVCPIGYEELYPKFGMRGHNGLDCRAGEDKLFSPIRGIVVEKQTVPARGLGLGIMTFDKVMTDSYPKPYFVKLRMWHLKQMYVEVGDTVEIGQLIGITDTTGYSAGNHLHFEGQVMDKDAGGHPFLADNANGIGAAFNIEPHWNGKFAVDEQIITLQQRLIILLQQYVAYLKQKQNG